MAPVLLVVSLTKFWQRVLLLQWLLLAGLLFVLFKDKAIWLQIAASLVWLIAGGWMWLQKRGFDRRLPFRMLLHETHLILNRHGGEPEYWFVDERTRCWSWMVQLSLINDDGKRNTLLLHASQLPAAEWSALLRSLKAGWGSGRVSA